MFAVRLIGDTPGVIGGVDSAKIQARNTDPTRIGACCDVVEGHEQNRPTGNVTMIVLL